MTHTNLSFTCFEKSRILITGATGFVGYRLAELLTSNTNAQISCLVRSYGNATKLARLPVEMIKGDVLNSYDVEMALKNVDFVFHCAYGNSGDENTRISTNTKGTELICKFALKNNIKRLVFLSTISVYKETNDEWLTEKSSETSSKEPYAFSKLQAEKVVNEYIKSKGLAAVILQPSAIYGPWAPSYVMRTFTKLKVYTIPLTSEGKGVCNAVYIDDLIQAMLLSANSEVAIGKTYLVNGDDYITWEKYYTYFSQILKRPVYKIISSQELKTLLNPKSPFLFATLLKSMKPNITFLKSELKTHPFVSFIYSKVSLKQKIRFAEYFKNRTSLNKGINNKNMPLMPIDKEYVRFHKQYFKANNHKIKAELNFKPNYNFEKGFEEINKWYCWFYNK